MPYGRPRGFACVATLVLAWQLARIPYRDRSLLVVSFYQQFVLSDDVEQFL